MDDLVKRSDIFRWLCEYCLRMKYCDRTGCADAEIINSYLHSVDAVEVVRCGECVHRYVAGDNVRFNVCELNHNKAQSDEWFCADGERRTDEAD